MSQIHSYSGKQDTDIICVISTPFFLDGLVPTSTRAVAKTLSINTYQIYPEQHHKFTTHNTQYLVLKIRLLLS